MSIDNLIARQQVPRVTKPRTININAPTLFLLGCVFLLRALIPTGWMPASTSEGFQLELCGEWAADGSGTQHLRAAQQIFDAAIAKHAPGSDHDDQDVFPGASQPCTFASLAMAWIATGAPVVILATQTPSIISQPALIAATGRGLASPPPPSTGPPILS